MGKTWPSSLLGFMVHLARDKKPTKLQADPHHNSPKEKMYFCALADLFSKRCRIQRVFLGVVAKDFAILAMTLKNAKAWVKEEWKISHM